MTTRSSESDSSYKQKVATSFSRAAHSYDEYALFQEQVLTKLMAWFTAKSNQRWLDLGTGTGKSLQAMQMAQPELQSIALDLSFSMLQQARRRVSTAGFVCADAEALPFQDASLDGVFSSLAIQWCLDPQQLFRELHRVLKNRGQVVVSTLLAGSMSELGQAWQCVDGRSHHNHYPELDDFLKHCKAAGFDVLRAEQRTLTVYFDSVKAAVYSLKKVGASLVADDSGVSSPSKWKAFEVAYAKQATEKGIPLSYEVAFIQLMKVDHG
ncbi:malonyl-ACP O-methyltransferase BioC [Marinomonas fungiae]|uniref:Malonyl-[acyl-carrier protein] O-methyltransferase n=1 Tax=Marinomonas fungiae TaxID=1137284 RepID=A0A0K6IIU6_9GAMM|nr:malonyl-ACP O-methyltransferase BioC [Marinomonas fungiae]CUB03001.1 malonyl-acyl carrier protein O-methyltransferase BioC [Marinomonas fungiae]